MVLVPYYRTWAALAEQILFNNKWSGQHQSTRIRIGGTRDGSWRYVSEEREGVNDVSRQFLQDSEKVPREEKKVLGVFSKYCVPRNYVDTFIGAGPGSEHPYRLQHRHLQPAYE